MRIIGCFIQSQHSNKQLLWQIIQFNTAENLPLCLSLHHIGMLVQRLKKYWIENHLCKKTRVKIEKWTRIKNSLMKGQEIKILYKIRKYIQTYHERLRGNTRECFVEKNLSKFNVTRPFYTEELLILILYNLFWIKLVYFKYLLKYHRIR